MAYLSPSRFSAVLLLALTPCFGACASGSASEDEGGPITLEAPVNGSFQSSLRVDVRGAVSDDSITTVDVNGELVDVLGGTFETVIEASEGPLRIVASANGESDQVTVVLDRTDPEIVIESPERGAFVNEDALIVTGQVTDATDITLTINNAVVSVDDAGRFEYTATTTPGAHRFRVKATDAAGNTDHDFASALLGEFLDEGTYLEDAFLGQLGPGVFDVINEQIGGIFTQETLSSMLVGLGELRPSGSTKLRFNGLDYEGIVVTTTPENGQIFIEASLQNVNVHVEGKKRVVVWTGWIDGILRADEMIIRSRLAVSPVDGRLQATLMDTEVEMVNQRADVDGFFGWLVELLVSGTVRELPNTLQQLAQEQLPPLLNGFLENLSPSFDFSVASHTVAVDGQIADFFVTEAEGIRALGNATVSVMGPDGMTAASPGALFLPQAMPTSPVDHLRAGVSVNLFNTAFHGAWATGLLDYGQTIGPADSPLKVRTVALFAGNLPGSIPIDSPVRVEGNAFLPPVLMADADGRPELRAVDVAIRVIAVETDEELFELSASLRASLEISERGGLMSVSIGEYEIFVDQVSSANVGLPVGVPLDDAVQGLVGPILTEFADFDGFRIPTAFGLGLGEPDVRIEDGMVLFDATVAAVTP